MSTPQTPPGDIDAYIAGFPNDVQQKLQQIRATIRAAVPDAEETIGYAIPSFTLAGRYLIHFAAYKRHIGLYPVPVGSAEFEPELSAYAAGKGTARFPLDAPIPFALITRIVKLRAAENLARAATRRK